MTLLSVLIVNWNTRDDLRECLRSIGENLTSLRPQVIVVDNGSRDGSAAMVSCEFPAVTLLSSPTNLGFARANNRALQQASGDFLLLLNPDTRVGKGAIEGLIETMAADPAVGIAGLQLLNSDGSKQNSISSDPSLLTELTNKSLLRMLFPRKYPGKELELTRPIDVDAVIGACMLVRRKAFEEVGPLDEDYFLFLEETDWCRRMRRKGWKVVHDPRFTVLHLQGKSAGQVPTAARTEYWKSRYRFFQKHYGPGVHATLKAGLILKLAGSCLVNTVLGLATGFLHSKTRQRLFLNLRLLEWHLRGCPPDWGLRPPQSSHSL
ncbi:MAG TPA: glycosyltransferase family 2 protein [Syntrophobacteraceae bacterium]|nr:glycosyltransferase family 2 protein [Syntrophobacteraceae bacterium]